jgi:hypothetical protein
LSEFSAGMQIRQHQLDGWHLPFRVNIDRNTTTVVAYRNRSIHVDDHVDLCAKSGQMFVDRIIENFVNQVMQPPFVRVPNEHSRPLPDCFEAFELVDLRRVVFLRGGDSGTNVFDRNFLLNLRHKNGARRPT